MADPLSIAASIAGLIALSGSIYKIIRDFVEQAANPPQSACTLLLEVSEMRMVLRSLSDLIDNFLIYPPKRRALVQLDHLIICLTQTVLSFSELEKFVDPWVTGSQRSLWRRWKLISQAERMTRFNAKLQYNKISISLVISIIQCQSDTDAQQHRLSLEEMVRRTMDENKEIHTRLDQLGSLIMGSAPSITTTSRRLETAPSIGSAATAEEADDEESTIRIVRRTSHRSSASRPVSVSFALDLSGLLSESGPSLPFENELAQSLVYRRVRRDECDISFTTSEPTSGIWSMLSGLSLDRFSNISVIALPITLNDISNSSWYTNLNQARFDLIALNKTKVHNIAVLGECEVGKSTLITTLCFGGSEKIDKHTMLSTEFNTYIVVDGVKNRLEITDTPGPSSEYAALVDDAIQRAEAFVLMYSLTDRHSFSQIRSLYNTIICAKRWPQTKRPPVVIVANKADLEESRVIYPGLSFSLAEELNCSHFELSVESGNCITLPFIELVRCTLGE